MDWCGGRDSCMLVLVGEVRIGEYMGIKLGLLISVVWSINGMKMYRFVLGLYIDCEVGVVVEGLLVYVWCGCGSWVWDVYYVVCNLWIKF